MKFTGLKRIDPFRWEVPKETKKGMRVPALIFASEQMLSSIDESAIEQIANAACLPGVVTHTLAMPDIHSGYGMPIGGVMATDLHSGVISPGAAGYDINCGVRLLNTPLEREQISEKKETLPDMLQRNIPSGIGRGGLLNLSKEELVRVITEGAQWAVQSGYGTPDDITYSEAGGCLQGADPDRISKEAIKRGRDTFASLGSGNHFCEIQYIDEIYDEEIARKLGIRKNGVTVMIHTGSRGFGHQVATDYLKTMEQAMRRYRIDVPDKQLACAPIESMEGKAYLSAMHSAANFAWANRQMLTHLVRELFAELYGIKEPAKMPLMYDVAHNIIKRETHIVEGKARDVMVHRKGATRAFGPGHAELPERYSDTGQPVLVPGDMGRMSYLLVGAKGAMEESFGSTCHGAGRQLSRHQANKVANSKEVKAKLSLKGIEVRAAGRRTLAEEFPEAYKDVSEVVEVVEKAGLALPVARLRPMVVVKG